jgi:transcription elongation factor GreA-like protein
MQNNTRMLVEAQNHQLTWSIFSQYNKNILKNFKRAIAAGSRLVTDAMRCCTSQIEAKQNKQKGFDSNLIKRIDMTLIILHIYHELLRDFIKLSGLTVDSGMKS